MYDTDTIAGIATATGVGGIAIIRISGQLALDIMQKIFIRSNKEKLESHKLYHGYLHDEDERIDECMACYMASPKTYTKEDVVEIHTHGGHISANKALELAIKNGARLADRGEFTKRAFLNGRIDLSQAEAVMAMINAQSEGAAKSAFKQLEGLQSKNIKECIDKIISILSSIEACLDFPEEIDEQEALSDLLPKIEQLHKNIESLVDEKSAKIIREGFNVVLCGNPNAGKSTLFNTLLNKDRAIVTDIAGTTRDIIDASFRLDDNIINIYDTAGLRETEDPVEAIGVNRAKSAIETADCVLYLFDMQNKLRSEELETIKKYDKLGNALLLSKEDIAKTNVEEIKKHICNMKIISISALNGSGIETLKEFIREKAKVLNADILVNQRHINCAKNALLSLINAHRAAQFGVDIELVSLELKEALHELSEIVGQSLDEKILDKIFSSFCVGK